MSLFLRAQVRGAKPLAARLVAGVLDLGRSRTWGPAGPVLAPGECRTVAGRGGRAGLPSGQAGGGKLTAASEGWPRRSGGRVE